MFYEDSLEQANNLDSGYIEINNNFNRSFNIDASHRLNDTTIKFLYYQDLKDLLYFFPGVYILDLGSFGQNHGVLINYNDHRSIEILDQKITTIEPLGGSFDLNNYAVEDIETIEYVSGPKAFLYGFNSNSGVFNIKRKNWRYSKSFSKIRYSESAYEETSLDGVLYRNILHNLNLTLGIRRNAADGRYTNSEYDSWNLRFRTNYNLTNGLDFFITTIYNQNKIGTNGGIDLDKTDINDAFDRLKAVVKYESAYQKTARNDLQLGLTGKIFKNSNQHTDAILYLSNQMSVFTDPSQSSDTTIRAIKNHTRWMGIKIDHSIDFDKYFLKPKFTIGSELRQIQILQSSFLNYTRKQQGKITGDLKLTPANFLSFNIFTRYLHLSKNSTIDAGATIDLKLKNILSLSFGHSRTHRSLYEMEKIFSVMYYSYEKPLFEQHNINELSIRIHPSDNLNISLTYFVNNIRDAVVVHPNKLNISTQPYLFLFYHKLQKEIFNTSVSVKFWKFESITNLTHNIEPRNKINPKYLLFSEISFKDKFFNDNLFLKLGFRFKYLSEQYGYSYDSRYNIYYPNRFRYDSRYNIYYPDTKYILGDMGYLDAFLFAHIGNAIVNLTLENIFDNNCVVTYYYPLKDRSLRLGVNWIFED